MDKPKNETWRLRYLRILTGPVSQAGNSQEDLQAIEDLVDEHLIRGSTIPDHQGVVRGAALVTGNDGLAVPTLKGRLFIEDQKAFLRSKTLVGRLKTNWPLFSGIIGIVIGWSLGLLSPLVQQRLHPAAHDHNPAQHAAEKPKPPSTPNASVSPTQ